MKVVPPLGDKREVSTTAEAIHFVNAKGKIEMVDCVFESQKDDATNVHGLYARITRKVAADEIEVRLAHPQQLGVDCIAPGMRLELTQGPSLKPPGCTVVKNVIRLNKEYTIVKTAAPLPETLELGDVVAHLSPKARR